MATPFTFETASGGGILVGGDVSLALDKAGNPSIVFSERGSGQIVVARRSGGTWTQENVPNALTGSDSRPCLAIDSLGNPRLAYKELTSGLLTHAIKSATGQWSTGLPIHTRLTLDHGPGGVSDIAFALHPGHIDTASRDVGFFTYVDQATGGIGFAHTGTVGPTPVTVEADQNTNRFKFTGSSVAFDSSENFFVAYVGLFNAGGPQAVISIRSTDVLDIEKGTFHQPAVAEESGTINVNRPTSIVRTSFEGCIAYYDTANKILKANFTGEGSSVIETVAANVNNDATPSAAVNRGGFRVAYADTDAIKLASRSPAGDWTIEVVDPVSGAGSPSLAYDNSGIANIAYVVGGALKYARRLE